MAIRCNWLRSANYSQMPTSPRFNPASPHARGLVRAFPLAPTNMMVDVGPIGGPASYRVDQAASALRSGHIPHRGAGTYFDGQQGLFFTTVNFPSGQPTWTYFGRCMTTLVNNDYHYVMNTGNTNGALHITLHNSNFWQIGSYASWSIQGVTTPLVGLPYDVCATYDGVTVSLYVNGLLDVAVAQAAATWPGTQSTIGTAPMNSSEDNNWVGTLQDIRWLNVGLSAKEVAALSDSETAYALYYPARPMFWDVAASSGTTSPPARARYLPLLGVS